MVFLLLTLAAPCRANVSQVPDFNPSGRVRGTVEYVFTLAAAAITAGIGTLQRSRSSAGIAGSGREGGGAGGI